MTELVTARPDNYSAALPLSATMILSEPLSALEFLDPADRSELLDRAYDEFLDLADAGVAVDPDEFCDRFPAFRTSLGKLLEAHQRLEENPELFGQIEVDWPEPGDAYFGFGIVRELGRGAFARVYLACERAVGNRLVAIKVSAHRSGEAHTLGKLRHPNVVPILSATYDVATHVRIVCMPYLGATTLGDILDYFGAIKRRPHSGRELLDCARDPQWADASAAEPPHALTQGGYRDAVVHIIERLADALRFVHARGFLHRDLKPSNVLLTPNGVPVLIDFNLALDPNSTAYRFGGTLPYMPPEHLGAETDRPGACDARGDIYALGVIAYELLAGVHPFGPVPNKLSQHEARDLLLERIATGPRPLRELNPDVNARLADIVMRCIAADPADRPANAGELVAALRGERSWTRRALRWASAHARPLTAAALLAAVPASLGLSAYARMSPLPVRQAAAGDEAYNAGRYGDAIKAYTASLDAVPDQPDLHFRRGRAYHQIGEWAAAITEYQKAKPDTDCRAAACLGACLAATNLYVPAVKNLDFAINNGLATAEVYADKAYCLAKLKKYSGAEMTATQALAQDPKLTAARYTRAIARLNLAGPNPNVDPRPALEDIRAVLAAGNGTADQFNVAATLCALTIIRNPDVSRDELGAECRGFAVQAILHGIRVADLKRSPLVGPLVQDFPDGLTGQPRPIVVGEGRLVDPLKGSIQ